MAPKKASAKKTEQLKRDQDTTTSKKQEHEEKNGTESKKRKADTDHDSSKLQRRSGRGNSAKPSHEQLIQFLLSKEAEDLTRPDDENEDMSKRGEIKTYSATVMNPFEELMCAVILSRPISHRLGLRTIRTVLNDPYNFTSAKSVKDAGSDKQHQALWDARTQHKDKTAEQIGSIAEVVLEQFTSQADTQGKDLGVILEDDDVTKALDNLKSAIKGLGKTGLSIFRRRVQWLWEAAYPFIDDRTADSLRRFGLPYDAEELVRLIDQCWKKTDTKHVEGKGDAQKRRAFVMVLERAIGADLEGKIESVISSSA